MTAADPSPPAATPARPRSRSKILALLTRGYAASPLAFSIALAVHAVAIAAGLYYYGVVRPAQRDSVPVPVIGEPHPPVTLLPPRPDGIDDPARATRALLGDPASELPPPDLAPQEPPLPPGPGTAGAANFPSLPFAPVGPPIMERHSGP